MECLLRLRWGRILAATEERYDVESMNIVRLLLIYGKLTVGDIINLMGANGQGGQTAAILNRMTALVRENFLQPTHPELQIAFSDQVARKFAVRSSYSLGLNKNADYSFHHSISKNTRRNIKTTTCLRRTN